MSASDDYSPIRRITDRKTPRQVKYDVEVPRGRKDALRTGRVPFKKNLIPWSHTKPSNEYVKEKSQKTISISHSTSFSTSNPMGLRRHDLLLVDM